MNRSDPLTVGNDLLHDVLSNVERGKLTRELLDGAHEHVRRWIEEFGLLDTALDMPALTEEMIASRKAA